MIVPTLAESEVAILVLMSVPPVTATVAVEEVLLELATASAALPKIVPPLIFAVIPLSAELLDMAIATPSVKAQPESVL